MIFPLNSKFLAQKSWSKLSFRQKLFILRTTAGNMLPLFLYHSKWATPWAAILTPPWLLRRWRRRGTRSKRKLAGWRNRWVRIFYKCDTGLHCVWLCCFGECIACCFVDCTETCAYDSFIVFTSSKCRTEQKLIFLVFFSRNPWPKTSSPRDATHAN